MFSGVSTFAPDLLKPRTLLGDKSKFACAFIGNPQPTRLHAIEALQELGQVDIFGPKFKKQIKSKIDVSREYRYMVCFENNLYPGYVTEKLIDAYVCETIPIYWGDIGESKCINEDAFFNVAAQGGIGTTLQNIKNLSNAEYETMFQKPLLKFIPDFTAISNLLLGESP
jgi:hypothetical protein